MDDVDLNRLADYVGGALRGTPSEDEVRQLVAANPALRDACASLRLANAAVGEDLSALTRQEPTMPADVTARITARLALERPVRVQADHTADRAGEWLIPSRRPGKRDVEDRRRGTRHPDKRHPDTRHPSTRHPGTAARRRWSIGASVIAGITALAFGAVIGIPRITGNETTAADSRQAGGSTADVSSGAPAQAVAPLRLATGTDYSASTLASVTSAGNERKLAAGSSAPNERFPDRESADTAAGVGQPGAGQPGAAAFPDALALLASPVGLNACLASVTTRHGGQASVVDYAAFEGAPALIIVLIGTHDAPGKRLVIAVGPRCGVAGSPDERSLATGS